MKTMTFLNLIREQKCIIHIPRIQRDYAQGRELPHETDVRKHLLQAMDDSLQKGKTLHLGVIMGNTGITTMRVNFCLLTANSV